jgi:predicted enzyme related to lactoylglutathione lyase
MKSRGVDFFCYTVSNISKSAEFYENTLGLTLDAWMGPGWVEFAVGETPTVLALRADPNYIAANPEDCGAAIAIAVDDVHQAVAELRAQGVDVMLEPGEQATCHAAGIADPDGNLILLHRRKDGTAG